QTLLAGNALNSQSRIEMQNPEKVLWVPHRTAASELPGPHQELVPIFLIVPGQFEIVPMRKRPIPRARECVVRTFRFCSTLLDCIDYQSKNAIQIWLKQWRAYRRRESVGAVSIPALGTEESSSGMLETGNQTENQVKTNGWGIDQRYEDAFGKWHDTPKETIDAIMGAMGAGADELVAPRDESVIVARTGEQLELAGCATVTLESGEVLNCELRLPSDLPSGYHQIHFEDSEKAGRLIVSPGKCDLPEQLRTWGWAVQLYAARSRESWGIGDFADLDKLAKWSSAELGAGMMLLNPLSAATPITPQQGSPYFPASRRFFNPMWIHVEWVPGANTEKVPQLEEIAKQGRALNRERLIQRDRIFELKMEALELLWLQFQGEPAFDAFCKEHGADLDRFALFCTL